MDHANLLGRWKLREQHPDAQTMEWCRQMLAGEISLEEYLDLVIRRATE